MGRRFSVAFALLIAAPALAFEPTAGIDTPSITIPATASRFRGVVERAENIVPRPSGLAPRLDGFRQETSKQIASGHVIYESVGGPTYVGSSYFPWHVLDDGVFPSGTAPVRVDSILGFAFAPYWPIPERLIVDVILWDGVTRAGPVCTGRSVYGIRLDFGTVQPLEFGDAYIAAPFALPNPPVLYDDGWGIEFRFLQSTTPSPPLTFGTPSTLTTIVFAGNSATGSQPAVGENENVFWLDANENGTLECDAESAAFSDPTTQPAQFYLKLSGTQLTPPSITPAAGWYSATSGNTSFRVHVGSGGGAIVDAVQYSARLNTTAANPPCSAALLAHTDNQANTAVDADMCFLHTASGANPLSLRGCFLTSCMLIAKMHYDNNTAIPPCLDETSSLVLIHEQSQMACGVSDGQIAPAPRKLTVLQNMPNPFNPITTIAFGTGTAGRVRIAAYDAAGRRVASLLDTMLPAGWHRVPWNGKDDSGRSLPSGVYVYRVIAGSEQDSHRMVLLR